jgi:opacity protein-like surface antigen
MDFSEATQTLIAFSLRELALEAEVGPSQWQVLGSDASRSFVYGAFFGYNAQWEDVVLGVELNYNRGSFSGTAPASPITRATAAGGNSYVVTIDGAATMRITDLGTIRARAGWATGGYLPYVMVGFALGRGDLTRTGIASGVETAPTVPPTVTPFSFVISETKNDALMYGWATGVGLDVAIRPNWFLRGEYEYMSVRGSDIETTFNTVRLGAGYRF